MTRTLVALVGAALLVAASPAAGTPLQTPKRGGTVVFGPVAESSCLNPLELCGLGPQFSWILALVLPPALDLAPDLTWRPRLVSEPEIVSKQPFALDFRIRPEARWSDGVPVTARDFTFTYQAMASAGAVDLKLVDSIRVVNPKTFRVTLRVRTADWRFLFLYVLPRHALEGEDLARIWTDRIDNPKTGRAIGNGPFLVGRWERGKQITLVRNPRYWGPHTAFLDRLIVRFCQRCVAPPPAEVLDSLRTGAVDFTYGRDTENVPALRRIRGAKVRFHRASYAEYLTLRLDEGGHPALRNKLVRRAVAYGIDRAEIVQRLWGVVDPSYRPLNSVVLLNTDRGYAPNWNRYSYRPTLARRLLERAGCRQGPDRIYVCGGERLSLRFFTLAGVSQRARGLELMQAQLRRIGVETTLSYATGVSLFGQILPSGHFDAASFSYNSINGIASFFERNLGCDGPGNWSGYCQRLVTADLDQADRILDDTQRARALNRVDRRLAMDVPLIPLYQIPFVLAYKNTLRNVVPSQDNLFWNAEDWWLAQAR